MHSPLSNHECLNPKPLLRSRSTCRQQRGTVAHDHQTGTPISHDETNTRPHTRTPIIGSTRIRADQMEDRAFVEVLWCSDAVFCFEPNAHAERTLTDRPIPNKRHSKLRYTRFNCYSFFCIYFLFKTRFFCCCCFFLLLRAGDGSPFLSCQPSTYTHKEERRRKEKRNNKTQSHNNTSTYTRTYGQPIIVTTPTLHPSPAYTPPPSLLLVFTFPSFLA